MFRLLDWFSTTEATWTSRGDKMKILDSGPEHLETGSLGKFSLEKKKKKCEISHLGGDGHDKIWSFSHFFYFFSFMS